MTQANLSKKDLYDRLTAVDGGDSGVAADEVTYAKTGWTGIEDVAGALDDLKDAKVDIPADPTDLVTALTDLTQAGSFTPDYAIQALTNSSPYGFATADEAETVLSVILNLQERLAAIETALSAAGLMETGT